MNEAEIKEIIHNCYLEILEREPDPEGLNHYLKLMKDGEIDKNKLEEILKKSDEFVGYKQHKETISEKIENKNQNKDPKIVAMYRIQNEERWIEKSLEQTSEICEEIVILDDCSTDNTVNICKQFSSVVDLYERKENLPLDEVRDLKMIWEMALKRKPDFILKIDGDEIIMPNSKEILLNEITNLHSEEHVFAFQFLSIYEKPNQYRDDTTFKDAWQVRLIKITDETKNLEFKESKYPGNIHCFPLPPTKFIPIRSEMKILHYSYYDKEKRFQNYQYYNKIDPNRSEFDFYKGQIAGDIDPSIIKLKTLPEGKFIKDIK